MGNGNHNQSSVSNHNSTAQAFFQDSSNFNNFNEPDEMGANPFAQNSALQQNEVFKGSQMQQPVPQEQAFNDEGQPSQSNISHQFQDDDDDSNDVFDYFNTGSRKASGPT